VDGDQKTLMITPKTKYMKTRIISVAMLLCIMIMFVTIASAEWITDSDYKFRINIPSSWSASSYTDGTDKIYDFYSPDENIAIQIRAFEATDGVTAELLAQVYESDYLPKGSYKQSLDDHITKNGIPGKLGVYNARYNEMDISMSAFYTVQNGYGYVLLVIVPTHMMEEKGPEIAPVTQSFLIDGFGIKSIKISGEKGSGIKENPVKTTKNPTADISGRYLFIKRSDGQSLVNYHYIDVNQNGTYSEKYQPKNSGNYVGGTDGTWKLTGDQLVLTHQYGGLSDTYTLRGIELIRVSDDGTVFTFRKQ